MHLAELWAIHDGLDLSQELGYCDIIVEFDALSIVSISDSVITNQLLPLIVDCRSRLGRHWQVDLRSIYREADCAADFMVKSACDQNLLFCTYLCHSYQVVA